MEEKTDQEQEKTEKKLDGNTNKKSLAWTPERREKQKLAMIRLQASGRAYTGKGKKKNTDDKTDSPEPAISDIPPPAPSPEAESVSSSFSTMGWIATILLIIVAAGIAMTVFFRDEIMKIFREKE